VRPEASSEIELLVVAHQRRALFIIPVCTTQAVTQSFLQFRFWFSGTISSDDAVSSASNILSRPSQCPVSLDRRPPAKFSSCSPPSRLARQLEVERPSSLGHWVATDQVKYSLRLNVSHSPQKWNGFPTASTPLMERKSDSNWVTVASFSEIRYPFNPEKKRGVKQRGLSLGWEFELRRGYRSATVVCKVSVSGI
jgi:hypothetical protein